jgi:hypothetical protein
MSKKTKKQAAKDAQFDFEHPPLAPVPQYPWSAPQFAPPQPPELNTSFTLPDQTYRQIVADVMHDNDAVVSKVAFNGGPINAYGQWALNFRATGSSKRERGDSYDAEIGELLATSRALHKLAARMERKARGRIAHADKAKQVSHKPLAQWEQELAERDVAAMGGVSEVADNDFGGSVELLGPFRSLEDAVSGLSSFARQVAARAEELAEGGE